MAQQQKIPELYCLSDDEKRKILIEWNDTQREYPKDKTIHQLFEEQVTKTPNNTAVILKIKNSPYNELNIKANQLAHCLRERGVKPDTLVAIAVERSLEMIIGILGILKAGGGQQVAQLSFDLHNSPIHHIPVLRSQGSQVPLFFIHPAGGLSFCYNSLTPYLSDLPVYAINHPAFTDPQIEFRECLHKDR